MKSGKSLTDLAAELERQATSKRDFVAPVNHLEMITSAESQPKLKINGFGDFEPTEIAHQQLAEYTGIPLKYYNKLHQEAPELLCKNVNRWLPADLKAQRMIRTLDGKARAILSDKFRPLDNHDLAEIALPEIIKTGCRVETCEITEKRMYIKAVTERVSFEVKKGDVVQAGIVISNSEVGMGSLSVEPLLFRLVCLNGAIMNDSRMRKTHVGKGNEQFDGASEFFRNETRQADDKAFWMKVKDLISGVFSTMDFEKMVQKWRQAQGDIIEADPIKVVEVAQQRLGLSQTEHNSVLKHLLSGGDLNRFGFANAITRTAQDVDSYDRATELERMGGRVIELPRNEWEVLAKAA